MFTWERHHWDTYRRGFKGRWSNNDTFTDINETAQATPPYKLSSDRIDKNAENSDEIEIASKK